MPLTHRIDYSALFNAASNSMALTESGSGVILDVNDAWIRSTGISRERAVGRTAQTLGLWASQEERAACHARLARDGHLRDFETVLMPRAQPRPHMISAHRLELDGQRHVLWEFHDISERKAAESALRKESEKNLAILRNASDGIHILDWDGNVIEASESF